MDVRGAPDNGAEGGKQGNGMVPPVLFERPLSSRSGAPVNRKLRASSSVPSFPSVLPPEQPGSRQSSLNSLCGGIQNMSIREEEIEDDPVQNSRSQVIPPPETRLPVRASKTGPRHSITPVKRGRGEKVAGQ
jgi:hypothetical protein